jgi:hypothetical protein
VPALRTEVTEIVTGLAMCGMAEVGLALQHRPPQLLNVDDATWARVTGAWERREYGQEFHAAWANGFAFLKARSGLRGKVPLRVEWKGPHRPPGYERVPADLRVDHVYLVSCKYLSSILHNASPSALFDHGLGATDGRAGDWYATVAPGEYQALYEAVRASAPGLPDRAEQLDRAGRTALKAALADGWPDGAAARYQELADAVAEASAARWRARLGRASAREEMAWRLLRLQAAPYFVLGTTDQATLRVRVGTPWDWRQRFDLKALDVEPQPGGQPRVGWRLEVHDRETGTDRVAAGHVEVRWSHGRFGGPPEAKVYLDTPHARVPGYVRLD